MEIESMKERLKESSRNNQIASQKSLVSSAKKEE
jgi:hypothetical protein